MKKYLTHEQFHILVIHTPRYELSEIVYFD